ncbi:sensor histidine kinase [Candidatus Formimonas warabiya]|uniref:histidine kinase n=1 Tax=Formimonas warabiya TaxID=1761012 RepID=A0A3G1KS88_FORW1|nr:histidine kinase N-terminal domain-containing protein [Candidatus Formimonas warabiya]ATW25329.1 histidine kinase [Candidatus Formimonas warabiya]
MSTIQQLCQEYTTLNDSDIEILEKLALQLPSITELTGNDIFIDALTRNWTDSIVLAWARPKEKSAYSASVVGELAYSTNEPAVYRTLKTGETTRDIRGVSQEGVPIAQTVVPITNTAQKVIGVLIMERDISKELQQEERVEFLSHTAEQLSSTLMYLSMTESTFEDWLGNGIFVLNRQGRITYANKTAATIYKTHCDSEALGNDFCALISDCSSLEDVLERMKNTLELSIGDRCYHFQSYPLVTRGELSGCAISVHDYTDLRKKEQELNAKSLIIREIHHRVKNNLQNIASLLRLQMRRSTSDVVKAEFSASINRILSIAFVYEVFARQTWETIDLLELSHHILDCLIDSSGISRDHIETSVKGQSVQLPSRQAVPLALVINELATNSIKHGIASLGRGRIDINLKDSNGLITLTVSDSGNDLYETFPEAPKSGLGLQIVESLVREQLDGFFRLERKGGMTRAMVCFTRHSREGE